MRIIGGQASGRRLAAVTGDQTRPTGDRVREALFNMWQARVVGAVFLDAYAGSGAVGLEAWSRGARQVVFTEVSRSALVTVRKNAALVGIGAAAEIVVGPLEKALPGWRAAGRTFDLIFCDPPWRQGVSEAAAGGLAAILAPEGMLVIESRASDPERIIPLCERLWSRRYGDTRLTGYGLNRL